MTFIYHIAAAADWARAVRDGQYTMSTRGRTLAHIYGPLNAGAVTQTRPYPPGPGQDQAA